MQKALKIFSHIGGLMRCFIAVPVKEELKDILVKLQEKIEQSEADIKFVERENLHFTIKFLGDVDETLIEKLKNIMKNTAGVFEPFDIEIVGLGCFPNKNYIRVLWVGLRNPQIFAALSEHLDLALHDLEFAKEQSYIPHLTIGRVRTGRNREDLLVITRELESAEIGKMKVEEIKLFRSYLSPKGPEYEELFTARLRTSR